MKPKEFDELVRQKFDQNEFEYNPGNWERLTEELDGRAKKRSVLVWWWMPLAGVAASVALAMGVTNLWQPEGAVAPAVAVFAPKSSQPHSIQGSGNVVATKSEPMHKDVQYTDYVKKSKNETVVVMEQEPEKFGINLQNAIRFNASPAGNKKINLMKNMELAVTKDNDRKKVIATKDEPTYNTFKEEEVKKAPRLSINLSGGVSHSSQVSGYTAGATIRKMINEKVFVEGQVAFISANNTETEPYMYYSSKHAAGKTSAVDGGPADKPIVDKGVLRTRDVSYNLSYAQVSPSVGFKIIKRMSIAAGPDFQQVLADNRPTPATDITHENVAVAPLFDLGLIGKTEYAVTKNLKAGVSYRKGINNVITPMGKFIDRDYLQFEVKCAIFNR